MRNAGNFAETALREHRRSCRPSLTVLRATLRRRATRNQKRIARSLLGHRRVISPFLDFKLRLRYDSFLRRISRLIAAEFVIYLSRTFSSRPFPSPSSLAYRVRESSCVYVLEEVDAEIEAIFTRRIAAPGRFRL